MKHMTRRAFLKVSMLTLGATVAGCAPSSAPSESAKGATAAQPSSTTAPQPAAEETVTITYYSWGDEQKWASEKRCFEPFTAAHPEIQIDFQGMAWGPYWQKILAGIAAGDPPDVFRMEAWKAHSYYARGVILELDPYFQKDGIDPAKLFGRPEGNTQCVYKGKWYATPRGATGNHVIYYNRDLFDEAGIGWPEETPDWTWDDLLEIAKQLTKDADGDGKVDIWGFDIAKMANDWNGGQECVWGWGAELFDEEVATCLINSPEAIEALQFLADFRNKHAVAPYQAQLPEGMGDAFLIGKVAMKEEGGYMVNVYKIIEDFDWGIATVPAGPKAHVAYSKPNGTLITKTSKHIDEAWALLTHINAPETVKCEALEGLWPPNNVEVMQEEWYLTRDTPPYDMSPTVPGLLLQTRGPQFHPWSQKIREIMQAEFDPVWLGNATIAEVAPTIEAKVNEVLQGKDLPELS